MTTAVDLFKPSRADGRSDRQVVYELMKDAEPNSTFAFDDLIAALQTGVDEEITRSRAGAAARAANKLMLRERQRALTAVRGVGYRVLQAAEHLPAAITRRQKAEIQIRAGIGILRNCRLDELSAAERQLHEGTVLVMSGLYEGMRHTNSRVDRLERVVKTLVESNGQANG